MQDDLLFHRMSISGRRLLQRYLTEGPPDTATLRRLLFLEERDHNFQRPDHFYKSVLEKELGGCRTLGAALRKSLCCLAEAHLEIRRDRVHVKLDAFSAWQRLLTRVSPVPLVAYMLWREHAARLRLSARAPDEEKMDILRRNLSRTTLPSPHSPPIDEMIETEGLNELHIHLTGTTEADFVWHDALRQPKAVHRNLQAGFNRPLAVEQYNQIEFGLTPDEVRRRLLLARYLRALIADAAVAREGSEDWQDRLVTFFGEEHWRRLPGGAGPEFGRFSYQDHPMRRHRSQEGVPDTVWEAALWWIVFDQIDGGQEGHRSSDTEPLAAAAQLYLLLQGQFIKFVVQQTDQNGFDQFQKITVNEFRSLSEMDYARRYDQLARYGRGDLDFLEGRFAPKETAAENAKLLTSVLSGFARHHGAQLGTAGETSDGRSPWRLLLAGGEIVPRQRMRLGLVAHFVKEQEKPGNLDEWIDRHSLQHKYLPGARAPTGLVRDHKLRTRNRNRAAALVRLYERLPLLRRHLVGADAAANELHAGPETFAPAFRKLRRHGFVHFTYHAGEDFRHLLSGMRAVQEATMYLEMRCGDRIGHGTAVGIDPALWWRRIGGRVVLPKGEWLDNLIFAYDVLSRDATQAAAVLQLRDSIGRLAREIYGDPPTGPDDLARAWRLRHLDPLLACDPAQSAEAAVTADSKLEWQLITDAERHHPDAFKLFLNYHKPKPRFESSILVEVTEGDMPADRLAIIQRHVLAEIVRKEIVLEAMPTSNVRISLYDDYAEHHIFRWLGLEGDLPKPPIVLASDDPGIFANCLRNEFVHLYQTLVEEKGVSREEAIGILRTLNANGRIYRFRPADPDPT